MDVFKTIVRNFVQVHLCKKNKSNRANKKRKTKKLRKVTAAEHAAAAIASGNAVRPMSPVT